MQSMKLWIDQTITNKNIAIIDKISEIETTFSQWCDNHDLYSFNQLNSEFDEEFNTGKVADELVINSEESFSISFKAEFEEQWWNELTLVLIEFCFNDVSKLIEPKFQTVILKNFIAKLQTQQEKMLQTMIQTMDISKDEQKLLIRKSRLNKLKTKEKKMLTTAKFNLISSEIKQLLTEQDTILRKIYALNVTLQQLH